MNDVIQWGMIGCGDVATRKSGPAFSLIPHSHLYGVTSAHYEHAQEYAQQHNVDKAYQSAEEMLVDPQIDAVYIATPPRFHKQYALMCAKAGKPAYIEKPMANSYEDCQEIIQAFAQSRTKGYTAFYRRGMDKFLQIKHLIERGALGAVRFVDIFCSMVPHEQGLIEEELPWRLKRSATGGKFLDAGIHCIDTLEFLLGNIQTVKSIVSNQAGLYEVEDIVSLSLKFDSGIQGSGTWCFNGFRDEEWVRIIGEKGMLEFSVFDNSPFRLIDSSGVHEYPVEQYQYIQQPMIHTVVDDLRGAGVCQSTLQTAAHTTYIMDTILDEYRRTVLQL